MTMIIFPVAVSMSLCYNSDRCSISSLKETMEFVKKEQQQLYHTMSVYARNAQNRLQHHHSKTTEDDQKQSFGTLNNFL